MIKHTQNELGKNAYLRKGGEGGGRKGGEEGKGRRKEGKGI